MTENLQQPATGIVIICRQPLLYNSSELQCNIDLDSENDKTGFIAKSQTGTISEWLNALPVQRHFAATSFFLVVSGKYISPVYTIYNLLSNTTGCIVYTAGCQTGCTTGLTTGWTNSGCSFNNRLYHVNGVIRSLCATEPNNDKTRSTGTVHTSAKGRRRNDVILL